MLIFSFEHFDLALQKVQTGNINIITWYNDPRIRKLLNHVQIQQNKHLKSINLSRSEDEEKVKEDCLFLRRLLIL